MNLNPFIILISQVISLYIIVVLFYGAILWLTALGLIKKKNSIISSIYYSTFKIVDPVLEKIRQYVPKLGIFDISPLILFLLLTFIKNILMTYFYVK